jgi:protein TonB
VNDVATAIRFPASFTLALGFTTVMFWLLATLIGGKNEVVERQLAARIEFTRLRRDSDVKVIKRQKPEPIKPVQQAPATTKVSSEGIAGFKPSAGPIAIGMGTGLNIDVKGLLGGPMAVSSGGSDRAEMPLVRVEPVYPPRALTQRLEGWTVVEFTITTAGTTKDVRAVESQPPGVFDAASVKAVQSWKYNPKVEGGNPIERRGVRILLSFKVSR